MNYYVIIISSILNSNLDVADKSGPSSACRASLRSLDASYCSQLSDRSCLAIAAEDGCCFISRLAFAGCARVSDAGILAIAGQCPYLLYFNRYSSSYLSIDISEHWATCGVNESIVTTFLLLQSECIF